MNPDPDPCRDPDDGATALSSGDDPDASAPWSRLDPRMLLVHPVEEVLRLLPVLIGTVVLGSSSGNPYWGLAATAVLVAVGVSRWFTTTYRVGPVHVELRRGLLQRQELSIPRSRIRSVDVEQRVLHRLLGLAVVKIGTGQAAGAGDRNRFELNGLAADSVPALRSALLADLPGTDPGSADTRTAGASATSSPEVELARFDPRWVRYAPFSTTGLLGIAAVVGLAFQYGLGERIAESGSFERGVAAFAAAGVVVSIAVVAFVVLLVASIAACARYVLLYGNLRVTDDGRMLRIGHGLVKVRHSTLDRGRLRGVNLREPLALRLAGGARLDAIMTGVAAESGESSLVLPSAPEREVQRVAADVLTDPLPVHVPLISHGPAARRRRYTRALGPAVAVAAVVIGAFAVAGQALPLSATIVAAVAAVATGCALGWDRYRGLGHAVVPGRLVTRNGSVDRQRVSLDAAGIIGWTVRQSFFQRRAGLATVVAATPAGAGHYEVIDIPQDQAWSLIDAVTPGCGDPWTRR